MSIRRERRLLLVASLTCVAGSAYVGVWTAKKPELPKPGRVKVNSAPLTESNNNSARPHPSMDAFQPLLAKQLRRPLFDPPPPPPKKIVKPPPKPLRAKLLATMIESENSMAMLDVGGGRVELRRVGDVISQQDADAKIAEILAGSIVVVRGEDRLTLNTDGQNR